MAIRTSWKGFIKLSLVSVPVKAYTASSTGNEVSLNQLHANCNNRIRYKKVCPEHGEVSNDDIVKGYEYSKGEYVVIDDNELERLRTENDRSIQIEGFLSPDVLDSVYHSGKNYYLLPDGAVGQKPYNLLIRGMVEKNVCAVAQVVISGRENVVLLRPKDGMLVMSVLYHLQKVKSADAFRDEILETETTKEELDLTKMLIDASTLKDFDYSGYKDRYVEKLTQLIQMKVEGKEIVQVPNPEEPKIINLMEALKKSVAEAQASGSSAETTKRMSPSARAKTTRKKKTPKKKIV
jgi:DNA end-binding protein Ku